jgi:hypothetical protein
VQDVLGAVGGPQGEKAVIYIGERPAAPDRDQPRVTHRREDHASSLPAHATAAVFPTRTVRLSATVDDCPVIDG